MSDRDRKLAEMMGMCWHEADYMLDGKWDKNCLHYYVPCRKCKLVLYSPDKTVYNPDFSTPEWRARLMDWAVGQEWWGGFVEKQKSIFLGKWVRGEIDGKPWVNPESEFITYLWRNLASLIFEYRGRE